MDVQRGHLRRTRVLRRERGHAEDRGDGGCHRVRDTAHRAIRYARRGRGRRRSSLAVAAGDGRRLSRLRLRLEELFEPVQPGKAGANTLRAEAVGNAKGSDHTEKRSNPLLAPAPQRALKERVMGEQERGEAGYVGRRRGSPRLRLEATRDRGDDSHSGCTHRYFGAEGTEAR